MDLIKFNRKNLHGTSYYFAENASHVAVVSIDGEYLIKILDSGEWKYPTWTHPTFTKLSDVEVWLNNHDWESATIDNINSVEDASYEDFCLAMSVLGFTQVDDTQYQHVSTHDSDTSLKVVCKYVNKMIVSCTYINDTPKKLGVPEIVYDAGRIVRSVDKLFSRYNIDVMSSMMIANTEHRSSVINAAISTRDLAKKMVRVKSSNVWAYAMNIRNAGDKFGDVLAQFKGPNGGPGDIYIYYDVPVNVYRRWVSASSKGHFFWQYIRNIYKYSKLTGDKRGKLHNAIN